MRLLVLIAAIVDALLRQRRRAERQSVDDSSVSAVDDPYLLSLYERARQ